MKVLKKYFRSFGWIKEKMPKNLYGVAIVVDYSFRDTIILKVGKRGFVSYAEILDAGALSIGEILKVLWENKVREDDIPVLIERCEPGLFWELRQRGIKSFCVNKVLQKAEAIQEELEKIDLQVYGIHGPLWLDEASQGKKGYGFNFAYLMWAVENIRINEQGSKGNGAGNTVAAV